MEHHVESHGGEAAAHSRTSATTLEIAATILIVLLIVVATIYFRTTLLKYFGFYEPDGFYHFSIIKEIINNNFIPPKTAVLSGWPTHPKIIAEPIGLYEVTIIPYFFLRFAGVSYYTVMRNIPILFAFLDMILAFLLVRKFNKDRAFGLLVALFIGISMGNAARTSATIYRGDGFIMAFLLLSLIFLIDTINAKEKNRKAIFALASAFSLSLGTLVWNGAPFAIAVFVSSIIMLLSYAFITENKALFESFNYLMGAMFVWWVIANIYLHIGWINEQSFVGIHFLMLLVLVFIGTRLFKYLMDNKHRFGIYMGSAARRAITFLVLALIGVLLIYALVPSFVYEIFVGNGFVATSNFAATIEELQAPTPAFLFASFGPMIYTSPMNLVIYASSFLPIGKNIFMFLLILVFIPYLFMQVEGAEDGRFFKGKAVVKFHIDQTVLVLITFFLLAAYLQIHTVRFNSLLAVPLAIFSAYTFYWLVMYIKDNKGTFSIIALAILMIFNLSAFRFVLQNYVQVGVYYTLLSVVAVGAFAFLLKLVSDVHRNIYLIISLLLIATFVVAMLYVDNAYSSNLTQADAINPAFIAANNWISGNTPTNAVFLTLWPDGSLIEGIGNRTSITDSVGSQLARIANPFAAWIFNTTKDPGFLTGNLSDNPDYLLVRYNWLLETSGIFTESGYGIGNYNSSVVSMLLSRVGATSASQLNDTQRAQLNSSVAQLYGYNVFTTYKESVNGTTKTILMQNSQIGLLGQVSVNSTGNVSRVNGFLVVGNSQISPFKNIVFYNVVSGNYSNVEQSEYNATNNQTLLVQYSPINKPGTPINVTGIYMFNVGIANSNMFKFLFECGASQCEWNNNRASLQLVYINSDTKIFKISYNSTA